MTDYPVFIVTAVLAFLLSYYGCVLMKQTGVVDAPDGGRKQQASAVPRLGGFGVMAAIAIVYAAAGMAHTLTPELITPDWLPGHHAAVVAALLTSGALTLIGTGDDINGMGAVTKLLLVTAVCVIAPFFGVATPAFDSPFGNVTLPAITLAGSALWLLVFTNATNFMDGSNGLATGSLAIMFAGLGAAYGAHADMPFPPGLAAILAAIAAFLMHNLRGTLYAGDAGAFGLGGLFAALGLVSGLPVWTVALLALPFLADVLMTLVLRARRGDAWFEAHSDHAYQALLQAGWSHIEVALIWWGLSAVCAVAAFVATAGGGALPFVLFWVFALVFAFLWTGIRRETAHKVAGGAGR
ncbi:glycosyltransferase family 4 protein [Henriciella aquimarina]|uniref:glycosyltransferase family 4 protein n=1 Tax=Henriciella aquimarina TaxID=545261 RepID=UPI0009FE4184|nr:hypothetical protein [Henriciella aquimarina]